jgi:hypothetical protein
VLTTGVVALGPEAVARIVKTIAVYDDFCHANDPNGEHDFGSFEADGQKIFFKIDYFDKALELPTHRIQLLPSASLQRCVVDQSQTERNGDRPFYFVSCSADKSAR